MSAHDARYHDYSSHDDGELSDNSSEKRNTKGTETRKSQSSSSNGSPAVKSKTRDNSESEEDRMRRRLLERHAKPHHSGDDEEMFTIQPKSKSTERDRSVKSERERDRHFGKHSHGSKHSHDVVDKRRDREKHVDRGMGHRAKHSDRSDRKPAKITSPSRDPRERSERSKPERPKDRRDDRRDRDIERDDRKKNDKERSRKHKRSRSRTSSPDEKRRKPENRPSTNKDKKKDKNSREKSPLDAKDVLILEAAAVSDHESVEKVVAIEQSEDDGMDTTENEITSFTLDSPAGPKKYSKFDSSPEPDDEDRTPIHSDVELQYTSDEDANEKVSEDENDFDFSNARFEDLTDEQKALLTPDTKQRLEEEWQRRLISELPVFYPGIMGCRNVQEFNCVNKVEEGTYGVVFRARDRRTDEIVALKRLKMDKEKDGFPITSLREINMLLKAGNHPNIVNVREVLIGSTMDKIFVAMEFVEHDMKSLMDLMHKRGKNFTIGEQKTLMLQLLSGLKHMHDLWILHRDLKSSNLLLSHKGILKIADFGLAREFGSPLKQYTSIVVTLWYRSPELLLGQKLYSTPVDMWSVGCIMAEFLLLKPLFPGRGEVDQINKIFLELGTPTEKIWPGYDELPFVKKCSFSQHSFNQLRKKFPAALINQSGFELMNAMLTYDPNNRISAETALSHRWFSEDPLPTPSAMFPTFPAKSEQHKAPPESQRPVKPQVVLNATTAKLYADLNVRPELMNKAGGFSLKFDKAH